MTNMESGIKFCCELAIVQQPLVTLILLSWSFLALCMEPPTPLASSSASASKSVVLAIPVNTALSPNSQVAQCVQLYSGETWDEEEATMSPTVSNGGRGEVILHDNLSDEDYIRVDSSGFKIIGLSPLHLHCDAFRFSDFSSDLVILFPGGPHRNCTYSHYCSVIIGRRALERKETEGGDDCYDLLLGGTEIPSIYSLKRYGELMVKEIRAISRTCDPLAFTNLILGKRHAANIGGNTEGNTQSTIYQAIEEEEREEKKKDEEKMEEENKGEEEKEEEHINEMEEGEGEPMDDEVTKVELPSFMDTCWTYLHFGFCCGSMVLGFLAAYIYFLYKRWLKLWRSSVNINLEATIA